MAGNKSNYLSLKLLDHVLGNTAFSAPSAIYVGLWTTTLTDSSTGSTAGEPSGGSYGRAGQSSNNTTTDWPNASGSTVGTKSNGTAITFATATGSWGTITDFALVDNSTGGNILYYGALSTPKTILSGDTASFSVGALVVTED